MKTDEKSAKMIAQQFEAEQDHLNFLERILTKGEEPSRKREQVLAYCEKQGVNERTIWRELALFREAGAIGILFEKEPFLIFDYQDKKLRERILVLIKRLPQESLSDFRQLVTLTDRFLERVQFVCDFLLHLFLEREKGSYIEKVDTSKYTDFFVQKMFREIDVIDEIADLKAFQNLNDEYEQRLCDKLLDDELLE